MLLFVVLANDPSYLFIILVEEVFISSLISSKQLFPSVAGCHLIMLRCFHKPTTSLFFSLLVFQQLRFILLLRMLPKFNCGRSYHFLLRSLIPTIHFLFVRPGGIVMLLSSTNHLVLSRSCNFSFLVRLVGVSCFHSSSLILSSFVSFLNRSAVWNISYPLCHSFISSGGNVLLISSSILSSCQDHVQFLPFTVGVLPKLYHSYSCPILF